MSLHKLLSKLTSGHGLVATVVLSVTFALNHLVGHFQLASAVALLQVVELVFLILI